MRFFCRKETLSVQEQSLKNEKKNGRERKRRVGRKETPTRGKTKVWEKKGIWCADGTRLEGKPVKKNKKREEKKGGLAQNDRTEWSLASSRNSLS